MLTFNIFDVELSSNSSSNEIISLRPISYFYFGTKMLCIQKVIITKTTMSDCG